MSDGCLSNDALAATAAGGSLAHSDREHLDSCPRCQALLLRLGGDSGDSQATGMPTGQPVLPSAEAPLARGTAIGRYVVLDRLGTGGMGVVYTAYDPELDRRLAVKLLQVEFGAAHGQKGLLREAQAMARLSHPNVVAVHDVGTFGANRVFVAMELVKGRTLREWMTEAKRSWREVWQVFRHAGEGLAAAHAAGLIHRDFKPDNVLVAEDGRVRVTDFGIARTETDASEPSQPFAVPSTRALTSTSTTAGPSAGTPAYMAPEQHAGQAGDGRADQFSFGVTLYEALYGARPFNGEALRARRFGLPPPPSGSAVPAWVHRIVARTLSENPEKRFATMRELLQAMGHDPAIARRRWRLAAGSVALLVTATVATRTLMPRAEKPCATAGKELQALWNPVRAAAVKAAFLKTSAPLAADVFERVAARLDAYTTAWSAVRQEACQATRVRGTQSDEVLSLRMECLDRRKQELDALTELLAASDADMVGKALKVTYELGDLGLCSDVLALRARVKPPNNLEDRRKVEAERARLAKARVLQAAGKFDDAEALGNAVVKVARSISYRPLEAEALFCVGDALASNGKPTAKRHPHRGGADRHRHRER